MEPADALHLLGLDGPAGPEEVKRAYRRLARSLHPDAGGDADRFLAVQRAYEEIRGGTDARVDGPRAQVRTAGVDERWWEGAGAWHEGAVATADVDLGVRPSGRATPASVDLVAALALAPDPTGPGNGPPVRPVTLHSRAPGSRLHRVIGWLQPDLLATLDARPAPDGPRAGHDVRLELRAAAGKGRRLAGEVTTPAGWTRTRGTDSVRIARDLRPCHDPVETAVRVARTLAEVGSTIGWTLDQWFVLARPDDRPT